MFEREHHRRVADVLDALDTRILEESACLFGGGTAIALKYGEYRESVDVDFLVSDVAGYRALRQLVASRDGVGALALPGRRLEALRDARIDQYGIRALLDVGGVAVKLEIVLEARVALEPPGPLDRICGVATLTTLDMATSKLLASSDRWADDAVHSRDLIDLAMMRLDDDTLRAALEKARGAYGASIDRDLAKAVDALLRRRGRLEQCMRALRMTDVPAPLRPVPPAVLWRDILRLAPRARTRAR